MSSGIVRKLEAQRGGMRQRLALRRSNAIRYVAGHPGRTSAEIAKALGERPQDIGQMLSKAYEVRRDESGGWRLRHGGAR